MSGETYSIYVKVDSTQALNAAKDLEKMGEASVKAEVSIKNVGKASNTAATSVKQAGSAASSAAQDTHKLAESLGVTDSMMRKAAGGMDSLNKAATTLRSTFVLIVGIEIARFLRDSVRHVGEAADAYTNLKSKLDLATYSQAELNKAFTDSVNIANKYYTSVTDVAAAYAKFNPIVASLGRNTADTTKVVSSLSASLLISGNNTVDAAETFRQFAQAISGPKVQMEEMNTIIDSNQALWRGLQREFPGLIAKYGTLKEAISKQALTNEMLIDATIKLGGEFEALAARKVPTIANAFTVLSNSFVQYVGETDDATGASAALSNMILDLAEALTTVEGKGKDIAAVINTIAQAMAGARGVFGELYDMVPAFLENLDRIYGKLPQVDPEIAKLMNLAQGNVPIADLAAKPTVKPTTQPQLTPKGVGGDAKQAAKEAKDAEAAFKALIDAQISAASNSEKIFAANANNSKKRFELEADQIKGIAELKIRATKSETMRVSIAEEAQAKIIDSINQETNLRQSVLNKEIETTQVKLNGVQQEIDAADAHKLKQAERLELTTKQAELETELTVKRAERTQIELDAIGQIQAAEQSLAEARQQANEALVKEEALRQLEIMSSNLEYAKEMATGLAEAFGEVGAAIGGMSVAMAEYDKQSATIEIARKEAVDKAEGDQKRITEINDDAARKQAKAQIKSYGDMTQAAQGFFKKGTKGYEAMGAAVKVFRVFEMAQSALSFAKQMGDMGAMLAQFLGMESAKTTAKIANNAAQQASDATGAVTSATKAVADAGQGDPYTGIIRAAAMLAFMAAIGIAVGGGGGGSSATTVKPPEPGTGTVKGDPLAVSESISKSIGIIEENSSNDLNYSADMLDALYQIRDALGGVENLIASDLTPIISDLMLKFGDGVKQAGFIFRDQKLSKVLSSGRYEGFIGARIETESSQMMVTIKKGQTMVAEYGDKFARAFGGVIIALKNGIAEVGKVIGVTEKDIVERLKGFTLKGQIVDVAGLSAEDAAKKLEAAFSAMSDTMAMKALPEFKDFQQSGEGYFETISRVAEGINRANGSLELLGMEAIKYTEITDKNKDVAAEITRQTIMAQGDLSEGTRKYVKQLTGSAEDIIDAYKQILNITNLMRGAGFGTENIDRTMINAAGGLSAFEESLQSFRENFMTDQQRVTADTNELTKAFAELGISMPKSKDEFYAIAMGMDTSTEQGKKLFAQFLALNGKFSDLTDASQELADAQAEAAKQAADAAQKIQDDLIASLQKNVDSAFSAMQKAYQDLQKVQERFLSYSKTIRAYLEELTGGRSTFISPEERYRIARQEFQRISALAVAGDESALAEITKAGKDFLDASREYNASNTQFQSDFTSVTSALEKSSQYAEDQASIAENQLTVAANSYNALVTLNASTLTVSAAVETLNKTMASYAKAVETLAKTPTVAPTPAPTPPGSPANPIPVPKVPVVVTPAPTPPGSPANPIPVPKVPVVVTPAPVREIPGGALGFNPYGNNSKIKYSQSDAMNIIRLYYRQLLGREPENDAAILGHANVLINGTKTAKQVADENFKASQEYKELIAKGFVPGFAKGGAMGAGLSLVGEYGPELISSGGGYVSTAGATANFFKTIKDAVVITSAEQTALLKEQIGELQALVRLQSAANRELITQLSEIRNETAESTRIAKVEASA
jgi:tape measure domain-containing protein